MAKKPGTFTQSLSVDDSHSHEELESKIVALEKEVVELKKQVASLSSKKTVDIDVNVELNAKVEKILEALKASPKIFRLLEK